jgi:hypothetical protein
MHEGPKLSGRCSARTRYMIRAVACVTTNLEGDLECAVERGDEARLLLSLFGYGKG